MKKDFASRIHAMNSMYKLPINNVPHVPTDVQDRLKKFKAILLEEINEIDDIMDGAQKGNSTIEIATAIADLLGDITVYCRSEALKYGLPLEDILNIIMDSNESKLGADGKPIYDVNGKFLKGPEYWKPEPKIQSYLSSIVPEVTPEN